MVKFSAVKNLLRRRSMSVIGVRLVVLRQHLVFSADPTLQDYNRFTECGVVLYQICGEIWFCVSFLFLQHNNQISGIILVDMVKVSKLIQLLVLYALTCNIPCWFVVQSWKDSMLAVQFGIGRCLCLINCFHLAINIHEKK